MQAPAPAQPVQSAPVSQPAQPAQDAFDLLSWGAPAAAPQAQSPAPAAQQPQMALLDFDSQPTPSMLTMTKTPHSQQSAPGFHGASSLAASGMTHNGLPHQTKSPFDVAIADQVPNFEPLACADDLLVNVRRVACGVFTPMGCSDEKIRARYLAMIAVVRETALGVLPLAQVQQLEPSFSMLVQQAQRSTNKNKAQVIQVLKDLCTLQQIAVQYATIAERSPLSKADRRFHLTHPETEVPALTKLLQLVAGLDHLARDNRYVAQVQEFVQQMVVVPVLRTAQGASGFGSGVGAELQNAMKDQYERVQKQCGGKLFGVDVPEVLELGKFE